MQIITLEHPQEFNAILAALRYYQENGQGDPANRSDAIHDIACGMAEGMQEDCSLDADAIEALCRRINTAPNTVKVKVWMVMNEGDNCAAEVRIYATEAEARADVVAGIESYGGRRTPDGQRLSAASIAELCEAWSDVADGPCQIEECEIEVALA